ncbi:hypothetical protein C8J57DRAFT_1714174 [Mycena rebaudengoi]|nr:hypothetical protein C8J57DRAFT_1714174 [Mycena rebaudengoi]
MSTCLFSPTTTPVHRWLVATYGYSGYHNGVKASASVGFVLSTFPKPAPDPAPAPRSRAHSFLSLPNTRRPNVFGLKKPPTALPAFGQEKIARRWKERGQPVVPREWRRCRFCQNSIEDAAHALFICNNPELMQVREVFLVDIYAKIPEFQSAFTESMALFRAVLAKREVTPILAKLVQRSPDI